jgi:hypothetical protein
VIQGPANGCHLETAWTAGVPPNPAVQHRPGTGTVRRKGKFPCRQLGRYPTRAASRRTSVAGLSSRRPTKALQDRPLAMPACENGEVLHNFLRWTDAAYRSRMQRRISARCLRAGCRPSAPADWWKPKPIAGKSSRLSHVTSKACTAEGHRRRRIRAWRAIGETKNGGRGREHDGPSPHTEKPVSLTNLRRLFPERRREEGSSVHQRTMPPSTFRVWPVMKRASSEARNATAAAMSSGWPLPGIA